MMVPALLMATTLAALTEAAPQSSPSQPAPVMMMTAMEYNEVNPMGELEIFMNSTMEEAMEVVGLCLPDNLAEPALGLLRPLVELSMPMQLSFHLPMPIDELSRMVANFSLIHTKIKFMPGMFMPAISVKDMVQFMVPMVVEQVKAELRCWVHRDCVDYFEEVNYMDYMSQFMDSKVAYDSHESHESHESHDSHEQGNDGGRYGGNGGGGRGGGGGHGGNGGGGRGGDGGGNHEMNPRRMQKEVVEELGEAMAEIVMMQVMVEGANLEQLVMDDQFLMLLQQMHWMYITMPMEMVSFNDMSQGVLCMFDTLVANSSSPMSREEVEIMVVNLMDTMVMVLEVVGSPDMPTQVQGMLEGAAKGLNLQAGRFDNVTMAVMRVMMNVRSMVAELQVKEIVEMVEGLEERFRLVMVDGELYKVEKLLDQLMKMVWDDSIWAMVEQVMQETREMVMVGLGLTEGTHQGDMVNLRMLVDMGVMGHCSEEEEWLLCSLTTNLGLMDTLRADMVQMVVDMNTTMDTMAMEMEGMVKMAVGDVEGMLVKVLEMVAGLTEESGMACMMEEMGVGEEMLDTMGMWEEEMVMEMVGEEAAPINLIREETNVMKEMMELTVGSCPSDTTEISTMDSWLELAAWGGFK